MTIKDLDIMLISLKGRKNSEKMKIGEIREWDPEKLGVVVDLSYRHMISYGSIERPQILVKASTFFLWQSQALLILPTSFAV